MSTLSTATIYTINTTDPDRLAEVITNMRRLGPPTIRVVDCGDHYMALEGSHRLAAASALGLAPVVISFAPGDIIDITQFDWYEFANWAEINYRAGDVAAELFAPMHSYDYVFFDVSVCCAGAEHAGMVRAAADE